MAEIKNKFNSSFAILRANPRISGNVKITIDSSKNLWLNSIDSNDHLSKSIYKGVKISSNSDYSQDLYRFFDKGRTPEEFVFGVRNENSPVTTYVSHFEDQYDGFYSTGVAPVISDIYRENWSYFAPFWLGRKIPSAFVIYRIDDPIDFSYINPVTSLELGKSYKVVDSGSTGFSISSGYQTYSAGDSFIATSNSFLTINGSGSILSLDPNFNQSLIGDPINHFEKKILPKTSIVASFDMGVSSEIGKYLRKIQNTSNYKDALMDVHFEQDIMTYYNGVNYSAGVYDSKGEFLYDFYTNPTTQIEFDEFMTDGFKRNGIISYKYLNLEFLFDDVDAAMYSINRYFGCFVDEVPTGTFRLDGSKFFSGSFLSGNSPEPKSPSAISSTMETSFYQENPKGVRLFIDSTTQWGYLPSSDTVNTNPRFYYIKDNSGNYYSYKRILDYALNSDPLVRWGTNSGNQNELVISNHLVDLKNFTGFVSGSSKQFSATQAIKKGVPHAIIGIGGTFNSGEAIVIYHPLGNTLINGKKCHILTASDMSSIIEDWVPGSFYNEGDVIYFHPFGTPTQIVSAISGAINSIKYRGFTAFEFDSEFVIRCDGSGARYNSSFSIDCFSNLSTVFRLNRSGILSCNSIDATDWRFEQNFIGGSDYSKNRIKILLEDSHKIIPGQSAIVTNNGISIVDGIFACIDDVIKNSRSGTLKDYKTHAILTYADYHKNAKFSYSSKIIIEEIYDNESGVFSVYPVKDLDYDFWSSDYGVTPTEEYYRFLDLQPGVSKIGIGQSYCISKGCEILYDGVYYGSTGGSPEIFVFEGNGVEDFEIIRKDPNVRFVCIPLAFVKNPLDVIESGADPEPLTDLDNFNGFSGIQDIKYIDDLDSIITKKDQMNFGKLGTEYELLQENSIKNFVTKSRVTPYIAKWVYEGGTDVRGNEYRLNVNHAFTPFNFSPSFFSAGKDPRYFTHEWFLLETPRLDSPDSLVKGSLNYCSDFLDLSKITDPNPSNEDYFTRFFTIDGADFNQNFGHFLSSGSNPISEKYTILVYNAATGFSETLFRGVKIVVKRRTTSSIQTGQRGLFTSNDSSYDGYKFACLIRPIDDPDPYSPTPPVTYKIYENSQFKTITFVISIVNSDSRWIDPNKYWEKAMASPGAEGGSWEFNPTGIYGGLDYMSLYSLSDKLILAPIASPSILASSESDIKLSAGLNFSLNSGPLGIESSFNTGTINGSGIIPIIPNSDYNTDLRDEINNYYLPSTPISGPGSPYDLSSSPPLTINGTNENGIYTFYAPERDSPYDWYTLPWPVGAGKDAVYFNQTDPSALDGSYIPNFSNLGYPPPIFALAPVNVSYNDSALMAVYQRNGGKFYWSKLMEKISFADIAALLNSEDPYIKYSSFSWDSVNKINARLDEGFVLEASRPSAFIQSGDLYPIEDLNKPQSLAKSAIGYNLALSNSTNEFYRYGGGYNPKFRDIISFSSFKDDVLEDEILIMDVELWEKTEHSEFSQIGSDYEISINGMIRKELRVTRGVTYRFNFINFFAPGYGPSPSTEPQSLLVMTLLKNDGTTGSIYNSGVILSGTGDYLIWNVPYDAPDLLYYELGGNKYAGGNIFIEENLSYKNAKLGIEKDNFGIIKNVSYNKYATINPFSIDPNSGFQLVYPLIGECPFGTRKMSIFESTWDPGRYRDYKGPDSYNLVHGTRSLLEVKNFWGSKVMTVPGSLNLQTQVLYPQSISDVVNSDLSLYPGYEILYEETGTQIMAILMVDRSMISYFDKNGAGAVFSHLLLPDFGIGDKSSLSDDVDEYLSLNVVPTYKADNILVWIKKIKLTSGAIINEPSIVTNLSDHNKIANGFYQLDQVRVIEIGHLQYEFSFGKDPGYEYQIAFSYNLSKM